MNRVSQAIQTIVIVAAMAMLGACSSSEYIISTTSGVMITTHGQPKLDEKTGMYKYRDSEGRTTTIAKSEVKQIMER